MIVTLKIQNRNMIKQTFNSLGYGYVRIPLKVVKEPTAQELVNEDMQYFEASESLSDCLARRRIKEQVEI